MKVVILAGGLGTRLSEYTKTIPKPMVLINGKPILERIMNFYAKQGFTNFYIALGYKGNVIKKYFKKKKFSWKINLINTGKNTMTGGRLKRLKKYLKNETFMMTYGDGLSNINLKKLIRFHKKYKKLVTISAVRPPARFGYLKLKGETVSYFKEKSSIDEGWINGGFFVMNYKFLNYIKSDKTYLEKEPLEKITKKKQLSAFKHYGFWQCMDTLRDKENIEKILKKKNFK
jgi:glucose-1-phosphate cytidylyltransferase